MSAPHNPPAFPSHAGDPEMSDPQNRISCGGMTLRDWFAGQAVGPIITAVANGHLSRDTVTMARDAYVFADAMLAARKAEKQT